MNKKRIALLALAVLVVTGITAGLAYAEQRGEGGHDAQALANSKITLPQAVATAEQQSGGKAVNAGMDNENGTVRIAVEILGNQGVKTVLVDPQSGQVTGMKTQGDHDGEEND